jgi:hypothetical protein
MIFFESSAKQNFNVEVAFAELGQRAMDRQMLSCTDDEAVGGRGNMSMINTNKMQLDKKR